MWGSLEVLEKRNPGIKFIAITLEDYFTDKGQSMICRGLFLLPVYHGKSILEEISRIIATSIKILTRRGHH